MTRAGRRWDASLELGKASQSKGATQSETKGWESAWQVRETISYSTWLSYRLFISLRIGK